MTRHVYVGELAESLTEGRANYCSFRKVPSQASTAGWWVDLSMAAGSPPPNYYASDPLTAATLDGDRGIWTGGDVSPASKLITRFGLCAPTAGLVGWYWLLDYLLYYPFVDLDDLDTQTMDNTVTLPRYTDGESVQAMLVAVAPTTGGGSFSFTYVNQDGVEKTAPTQSYSTAAASIASLPCSQQAVAAGGRPFLLLADGDTGIRSLLTWTNAAPGGGLGAVVLVRPIADYTISEASSWSIEEHVSGRAVPPHVQDGAYLNLIMNCAATVAAGTLSGFVQSAWK